MTQPRRRDMPEQLGADPQNGQEPRLLDAVYNRRSIRRYERQPLGTSTIEKIGALCQAVLPLVAENRVDMVLRNVMPEEDMVARLGGYGRIVTPPHYLVVYGKGKHFLMEDIGYRAEQVAVGLVRLGLGSCFIGCVGREERVRSDHALPADVRMVAFLVFGQLPSAFRDRTVNSVMRVVAGATRKLPPDRLFHAGDFEHHGPPPAELAPVIEAARRSPSAVNAQPWRFLWSNSVLYAYVQRKPRGLSLLAEYRRHDGGICLANISLALRALGLSRPWTPLAAASTDAPLHPTELEPLACMHL